MFSTAGVKSVTLTQNPSGIYDMSDFFFSVNNITTHDHELLDFESVSSHTIYHKYIHIHYFLSFYLNSNVLCSLHDEHFETYEKKYCTIDESITL